MISQAKTEKAIAFYGKAIEIHPNDSDAYYNLRIILNEQGMVENAIFSYHKTIDIHPNDVDAYYNICRIKKSETI